MTRLPLKLTVPEFITAAVLGVGMLIMFYARIASHPIACDQNPDVARLSGVNVARIKIGTAAVSGLLAGIAEVLLAGKLGTMRSNRASEVEVQALAAAVNKRAGDRSALALRGNLAIDALLQP